MLIYLSLQFYHGSNENSQKTEAERERNSPSCTVRLKPVFISWPISVYYSRGLDNAGKTTIVKKFNGDDIREISPTLGFHIHTMEHKG